MGGWLTFFQDLQEVWKNLQFQGFEFDSIIVSGEHQMPRRILHARMSLTINGVVFPEMYRQQCDH